MDSKAETVEEYLNGLSEERREALATVRRTILAHLPEGYEEAMNWGMICYQVPLELHRDTYNGKPLMYAALAAQKRHMAVYLSAVYMDEAERARFEDEYRARGKRYDAGKSCIRFRSIDDLPLDLLGSCIASYTPEEFIRLVKEKRERRS